MITLTHFWHLTTCFLSLKTATLVFAFLIADGNPPSSSFGLTLVCVAFVVLLMRIPFLQETTKNETS